LPRLKVRLDCPNLSTFFTARPRASHATLYPRSLPRSRDLDATLPTSQHSPPILYGRSTAAPQVRMISPDRGLGPLPSLQP
jgi:hypothetical protein